MLRRWRRIHADDKRLVCPCLHPPPPPSCSRRHVWPLYGWFTALICIGSCAGALAFASNMRYLAGTYAVITDLRLLNDGGGASTPLLVRILLLAARTDGWLPVFLLSNAAGRRGGG